MPSCSITAASIFTTEHGVLLLQNEDIDQDGVRFMRAEHQNESESLSISEKSKNTSLQRTLAKPVEESFQRAALPESAGAEKAEMVMEMCWALVDDTRQFTCQSYHVPATITGCT